MLAWLIHEGFLRDVVAFATGMLLARLIGLGRKLRQHLLQQQTIIDLLNTRTPGGLRDLLDAYEKASLDPGSRQGGSGR